MRQIEDRWRINYRDPPNYNEEFIKMISNFNFNNSQVDDISNYRNLMFKKYLNKKCSSVCFNIQKLTFQQCFSNCVAKFMSSENMFEDEMDRFEDKMSSFEASGKDYFKN